MKKLFITLILFGITNVYAESGGYTISSVCDYAKSAIDTNNKTVMALNFKCIGTIIKSDSDLFKVGENFYGNAITSIVKTIKGINLSSYSTISSANNSNDLMFGEGSRKAGDIKSGGKGKSTIIGGTGKYNGITGECEYEIKYHPNNKTSGITTCKYSL